ncbi:hypothetical protein JXM67_15305 [candidate division WOR-3 bacterium]|nr:hypothetical protein [candidate division WOR-3 bacterium]
MISRFTRKRRIIVACSLLLIIIPACRWFVKPSEETVTVEQILGSYTYKDSSTSYSGRFLLMAEAEKMAVDLYGPFHIPAASIRYGKDSCLVYLPLESRVLIFGHEATLPFEGWELPLAPLASAYRGEAVADPDSTNQSGDTLVLWKGAVAYLLDSATSRLLAIRGQDWLLVCEGERMPAGHQRIRFTRADMELILELTGLEFVERKPSDIFDLKVPDGVEKMDYR